MVKSLFKLSVLAFVFGSFGCSVAPNTEITSVGYTTEGGGSVTFIKEPYCVPDGATVTIRASVQPASTASPVLSEEGTGASIPMVAAPPIGSRFPRASTAKIFTATMLPRDLDGDGVTSFTVQNQHNFKFDTVQVELKDAVSPPVDGGRGDENQSFDVTGDFSQREVDPSPIYVNPPPPPSGS